ncbi:hypothetical protein SLA2020_092730 [Shorea laevis]
MATNLSATVCGEQQRQIRDTPILRLATKEPNQGELHRFSFAGHLIAAEDDIRSGVVYSILKSAWRPKGGLEVHEQSKNTYIFILSDETEKDRIFWESPWFVKGSHMVLKDWPPSQRFDEIAFSQSAFWVQVHGLPKGCMTLENVQLIGSLFPRLISWDQSTLGGLESFLRLRVEIDVHTPLLPGFQFKQQGEEVLIAGFKYEKLVDFCYRCGMLGHTQKSCDDFRRKDDDGNYISQPGPQYGPQMRAPAYSPKRHAGSIREGRKIPKTHDEIPPQLTTSSLEPQSPSLNTKPVEQSMAVVEKGSFEKRREEQQDEGHVAQALPLEVPLALNAMDLQPSYGMITPPNTNPSMITSATVRQGLAAVDGTVPSSQIHNLDNPLDPSSCKEYQSTGQEKQLSSTKLGLILSQQVELQLSLGPIYNRGSKRRHEDGPSGETTKRACTTHNEITEPVCTSTQLQEALVVGRLDFYIQEQTGFFTNVEELVSVQRVRCRIRLKALARQVSFQPDQRSPLLQSLHPTQRLYTDPPVTPLIMATIQAPGTTLTHPLSSPSKSAEQFSYEDVIDRGSVAGPWQPPSLT